MRRGFWMSRFRANQPATQKIKLLTLCVRPENRLCKSLIFKDLRKRGPQHKSLSIKHLQRQPQQMSCQ